MCLAIPAKVLELQEGGNKAMIEQPYGRRVVLNNIINAKKGEFVLLQQGFIVERISEKDAKEAWKALEELD
ncbi:MAG: HypC/HybG/HupF family hydrogenase formation chaperone [Candidatus Diapherotrites archaeon]|nr:HypC/HybG/HupF family hydrogenase formation chaperone [Candidatus Diapherotrites archaeon]